MDFEQRYRAIDAKDSRFDGQFYTAVRSTGIYCRPSCPARTPRRENVSFFATSAAAHEAGYRACKRCLPEAAPGTPEWNLRSDVAARAMRLIIDGELNADRGGVSQLAGQLGYSTRQLGRILRAELGAGPLALARAARAQTARTLLTSTGMKFSEIAFASGFASIRQFNETVQQVFDLSPSQIRATAPRNGHAAPLSGGPAGLAPSAFLGDPGPGKSSVGGTVLDLRLPLRPPYDAGIFAFLAARAVNGVEIGTEHSYSRTLALAHGTASILVRLPELDQQTSAERAWATDHLRLRATVQNLKDLPSLLARVRRVFDLDADPVAIDAQLRTSAALRARVEKLPGIRLPGALDAGEMLLRAMIGQQITVSAARTQLHRLAELGTDVQPFEPESARAAADTAPGEPAGLRKLFPSPAQIVAGGEQLLRGPRRRIDAVLGAMRELETGLPLGLEDSPESLAAKLLPLPGIGPWTVNYLAMRLLGATDIHLAGDVAVRKGLEAVGLSAQDTAALSPWRSYATVHFWRGAAETTVRTAR